MKINNTFFVLDTETGGLDPNSASLMEIAGVILKDGKVVKKYSSIVKSPDGKYLCNDLARKMHGISDEMANEKGKLPTEIIKDLKEIRDEYFDGKPITVIAHNPVFDIPFIKKMFVDAGNTLSSTKTDNEFDYNKIFSRNILDTATMAKILYLQGKLPFERSSLDNILKFYNIPVPENLRHTALGDAKQTAQAFVLMFKHLDGKINFKNDNIADYDTDFDDEKKLNSAPDRE